MNLWPFLILDFIIQEPISSSALLLRAYQSHYSLWIVHGLFIIATLLDIIVGLYVGRILRKHFEHHRISTFVKKNIDSLGTSIGKYGKAVSLIVIVPMIFPVSSFFLAWFDITLPEAILYVLAGELVFWYLPEWLLVFTAKSFFANSQHALYAVIILALVLTISVNSFLNKKKHTKTNIDSDSI